MNATAPSKQQQRVENTRHAILDAAVELYHEQGVEPTTSSAIIERSGVGRTTFYRHFQDQDEVLNSALQRDFEGLIGEFEAQRFQHASLEAQIMEDLIWFVRQMFIRPALALLFQDDSKQFYARIDRSLAAFREVGTTCTQPTFERAQREGRLRDGVTIEDYVAWSTFVVTSLQIVSNDFTRDELRLRDIISRFLIPSLIRDP